MLDCKSRSEGFEKGSPNDPHCLNHFFGRARSGEMNRASVPGDPSTLYRS